MCNTGKIYVGTCGFSYKDWQGSFYPQFCPEADFLRFYASRLKVVEIDSTFYRQPSESMVKRWGDCTPDDFLISAKFPRTVTHEGSISQRIDNALAFIKTMSGLHEKLGPLLLQFPYAFTPDNRPLLESLINALPDDYKLSIELRNKKWLEEPDLIDRLREKRIALCLIDHPWMPKLKLCTGCFSYIRLLGDRKKIKSNFSYLRFDRADDLCFWQEVVEENISTGRDIFIFFDNHYSGHAPSTAYRFLNMLGVL